MWDERRFHGEREYRQFVQYIESLVESVKLKKLKWTCITCGTEKSAGSETGPQARFGLSFPMMVRYALVGHESIGRGGIRWGEVGSSTRIPTMAVIGFQYPDQGWVAARWAFRQILDDVVSQFPNDYEMKQQFEQAIALDGYIWICSP